jgi:hypothetical protein
MTAPTHRLLRTLHDIPAGSLGVIRHEYGESETVDFEACVDGIPRLVLCWMRELEALPAQDPQDERVARAFEEPEW